MDICDQLENWDRLPGRRFADVKAWIEAKAAEWGLNDVKVELGRPTDVNGAEHGGSYDRETNTITLHEDRFGPGSDGESAYRSAAHELAHALNDQVYEDLDDADEDDDPADGSDLGLDDFDSAEREDYARDFADAYMEALQDRCDGNPSEESPADQARDKVGEPPGPAGDWNLPGVSYG